MAKAKKVSLCAVLIALALALSYTERFIPLQLIVPLPGIKLGLANIVTLVALYLFKTKYAYMILIPRCVLGAVFGGGITGLLFSLCGGVLALAVMAQTRKCALFSVYGVSIFGAAAHNVGQILMAWVLMGSNVVFYLPVLILSGTVAGVVIGVVAALLVKRTDIGERKQF